jgi:hypothetical protein
MRFTDMMLSFPRLILLIVIIALFEPSIWLVVVVLGLTGWMGTARIVRGEVLSLREREFVQAARALGMSDAHHQPAHHPQHHGAGDRLRDARHRPHDPHRGVALLPGARRAAAHPELGEHDLDGRDAAHRPGGSPPSRASPSC